MEANDLKAGAFLSYDGEGNLMAHENEKTVDLHEDGCACSGCAGGHKHNSDAKNSKTIDANDAAHAGAPGANDGATGLGDAISSLEMGLSWSNMTGAAATVTYTYDLPTWAYASELWAGGVSNTGVFNANQVAAADRAIDHYEAVGNINFVQNNQGDSTNIVFRQGDIADTNIAAWALPFHYTGSSELARVDVMLDAAYNANPAEGSYQNMVLAHELGHALGLSHPGDYNGSEGSGGVAFYDNWNGSIMSYYQGTHADLGSVPTGLMIYDIAAIQELYGANHSHNAGNDTYVFGGQLVEAIWDGGGIDTFSAQGYTGNTILDLREGIHNVNAVGATKAWAAFGSNIENAQGGKGNDQIFGNALDNVLKGAKGDDILDGGSANDVLYGGKDQDILTGGAGNDVLRGNKGNDQLDGGEGNDFLYGGKDQDILVGGAGNDVLEGRHGNDQLRGSEGADIFAFRGRVDADTILDFEDGLDRIQVEGDIGSIVNGITYDAAGAHITLNNGSVTVTGITHLDTSDFIGF